MPKMTEQELAKALVATGLLSPQQVQTAAQMRRPGHGLAQIIVDKGWVNQIDILQVDPEALSGPTGTNPQVGAQIVDAIKRPEPQRELGVQTSLDAVLDTNTNMPTHHVGIGQENTSLDSSGVRILGEAARDRDDDDGTMGVIVAYCNEMLRFAVESRASDMHLEPRETHLRPRYRIDGELQSLGQDVPRELQAPILSRYKLLANLDITETRMPQDGRFRAIIGGRQFDFRVSTLPSIYGEKMVMRLLDRTSLVTDLTRLGFAGETRDLFEEMLHRSYGMILVTGPTGSGKTTTLYAALAATRDETKNIVTVEDPVEYEMPGITQTSINTDIGLTFATQLRAILRQDPDVILVGEIRDAETSDMAIRAALTGHLVLSTLHTNSAVAAVTRFQDMDVPSFLIASSLSGVLAQRLVRLLCRHCKREMPHDSPDYDLNIARLKLAPGTTLYEGAGCEECNHTGYRGRLAVIELLNVNREIRQAIMDKADATTLQRLAVKSGMKTLWQDAIEKVQRGLTTGDEVARVLLGTDEVEIETNIEA
jgi:type II secretory ATPase GspE/PulE/Tfp pilus assembly ATPase PilB-like protein